jgi:SCY1-like protein 1
MQQSYKRLCTANPKLRLSPGHFVEQGKKHGGFFQTPLIRMTEDIESLGLKTDAEREEFIKYAFKDLPHKLTAANMNLKLQ